MKKQALLAVSTLSLGVVGLATFTPVVNAETTDTFNATIKLNVPGALGIGSGKNTDGDLITTEGSLDVDFGTVNANSLATVKKSTIYTLNNTGSAGRLTIKDADSNTTLSRTPDSTADTTDITAGSSVKKGSGSWGYMLSEPASGATTYTTTAVTASDAELKGDTGQGIQSVDIWYAASTKDSTPAGTYSDTVVYTITSDYTAS